LPVSRSTGSFKSSDLAYILSWSGKCCQKHPGHSQSPTVSSRHSRFMAPMVTPLKSTHKLIMANPPHEPFFSLWLSVFPHKNGAWPSLILGLGAEPSASMLTSAPSLGWISMGTWPHHRPWAFVADFPPFPNLAGLDHFIADRRHEEPRLSSSLCWGDFRAGVMYFIRGPWLFTGCEVTFGD
jgi:hypothetical protein